MSHVLKELCSREKCLNIRKYSTIPTKMASHEHINYQKLIFRDGEQIRVLDAQTEEEVSEILEYIRANGYDLIAIEGRTHTRS